ncbi:MAG: hypothetical protein V1644_03075, partial [Candidatus Micrarchaeota archaeon]
MKLALFIFLLLLLPLVAAVPDLTQIYSTQEELKPAMSLDIQSQNVLFNDRGEKELFFDSVNSRGEIVVTPLIGDTVLLGGFDTYAVDIKPSSVENRGIKPAWDKKPVFFISSNDGNKLQIAYNSLSRECGGNYILSFTAMNPSLTEQGSTGLGFKRQVKLRLHILCKADLLMVVSPLAGEPPEKFLNVVKLYFDELAKTSVTARLDQLSADSLKSSSSKSLIATEFDNDYFINSYNDLAEVSPGLSAMLVDATEMQNGIPISKSKIVFFSSTGLSDGSEKEKIGELFLDSSGAPVHGIFKDSYGQVTASFSPDPNAPVVSKWFKFNLLRNGEVFSSVYAFPSSFCALTKTKDSSALTAVVNGYSDLVSATFSSAFPAFSFTDYLMNNPEKQGIVYSGEGCWFGSKLPFYLGSVSPDASDVWLNLGSTEKDSLPHWFRKLGDHYEIDGYSIELAEIGPKKLSSLTVHLSGSFTSATVQDILQDFEKSKNVKSDLDKLRLSAHEQYLLLVGSIDEIPMPIDPNKGIIGKEGDYAQNGLTPSDWRYAYDVDKNKFEFAVARLPSINSNSLFSFNSNFEPWAYPILVLNNILKIRTSSKKQKDKTTIVLADACGKKGNCFIQREAIASSQKFAGPCSGNSPNCLWSPSYCANTLFGCSGLSELFGKLQTSDYLIINEHGSGKNFGAQPAGGFFTTFAGTTVGSSNYIVVFSGKDLRAKFKPRFPLIIETFACYGGSIDYGSRHSLIAPEESTALAFIATGSPLFMGNSRIGKGSTRDIDFSMNNLVLSSIKDKDSRPVGEIMREKKNEGLLAGENWLVWTKQLY